MKKRQLAAIPGIISRLQKPFEAETRAVLGFDACIDNIVRVVKGKDKDNTAEFFTGSREFGEFLISREDKSCGVELRTQVSKIGGNMVITGNALGNLGIQCECIGTFGSPEIHPAFSKMSDNCSLYTVGEEIITTALEFNDSKVMMFDPGPYDKLNWDVIKTRIGLQQIRAMFSGQDLIALLNWSEIEHTSELWRGILDEVLPAIDSPEIKPLLFSDFSDCSRRSGKEIREALLLLNEFGKFSKVVFSMNRNESEIIARAVGIPVNDDGDTFISKLYKACRVDEIVIHRTKDALSCDGKTIEKCPTFFCEKTAILTGGGDNFNAGYCFAKLRGFDLYESLLIANGVSGYYVKNGISPDPGQLTGFLKML